MVTERGRRQRCRPTKAAGQRLPSCSQGAYGRTRVGVIRKVEGHLSCLTRLGRSSTRSSPPGRWRRSCLDPVDTRHGWRSSIRVLHECPRRVTHAFDECT
eukprot:4347315-Pleurochrysis_carterae.AAC.1